MTPGGKDTAPPARHLERGDELYFQNGKSTACGKVLAHGAHGATLLVGKKRIKVRHDKVLGHKVRVQPALQVVDEGEDGFLAIDASGRKRFIADPVPAEPRDLAPMAKALPAGAPLLLDVSCMCDEHTDAALEFIAKAIGEDAPGVDIWAAHPNPFIRRLVELFTERGLTRTAGLQEELASWLGGGEHRDGLARAARPDGAMARWSQAELALTRLYLQALPPEQFTLDDWLMVVDYLVQRYLPHGDLRAEADWLSTRANLMGRVHAAMGEVEEAVADTILASLPGLDEVTRRFGVSAQQQASIEFGRARCAESVTALADDARHRMRRLIVDHQQAVASGDRAGAAEDLQSKLLDNFGMMNRDWRRIAVTEAGENCNQGLIASTPVGGRVQRVEKYRGACAFCRSIDGAIVTVVDPAKSDKNGATEVWVGKTNVGRSASPRRRDAGGLVEREAHERWWLAAGVMHPNCRGAWVRVAEGVSEDPEFEKWLEEMDRTRGKP